MIDPAQLKQLQHVLGKIIDPEVETPGGTSGTKPGIDLEGTTIA